MPRSTEASWREGGRDARLPSFGIDVLSFEDPDGIQLELTTPASP